MPYFLRYSKFHLHSDVFNISSPYRHIIPLLWRAFQKTLKLLTTYTKQGAGWREEKERWGVYEWQIDGDSEGLEK